jgi:hypothetical protein
MVKEKELDLKPLTSDQYYCPVCGNRLLTHLRQGKSYWYCSHCRQETSYALSQEPSNSPDVSWIAIINGEKKQNYQPKLLLSDRDNQEVSNIEILMGYVAYFISRNKNIISPTQGKIEFKGTTYQCKYYHNDFVTFWQQLQQRRDFAELYLEGDSYCFNQLLNGNFTIRECALCHLPKPVACNPGCKVFGCSLCHEEEEELARKETKNNCLIRVLAIGKIPHLDEAISQHYFDNNIEIIFVSNPDDIRPNLLMDPIDLVLIHAIVSPSQARAWGEKIRRHQQLENVPIMALKPTVGDVLPWLTRQLELEDYLLGPLNGEHLIYSLLRMEANRQLNKESELCWFPR